MKWITRYIERIVNKRISVAKAEFTEWARRERKLRREQIKRMREHLVIESTFWISNEIERQLKPLLDVIRKDIVVINDKIAFQEDARHEIPTLVAKIEAVREFANNATEAYRTYLAQLEEDVTKFRIEDQAVRRLASLETRITILEQPRLREVV